MVSIITSGTAFTVMLYGAGVESRWLTVASTTGGSAVLIASMSTHAFVTPRTPGVNGTKWRRKVSCN